MCALKPGKLDPITYSETMPVANDTTFCRVLRDDVRVRDGGEAP